MKISAYILAVILIASALCSCKAKGSRINPLDTNTFDSIAVGAPLVLDTTIGAVPDSNVYKTPDMDKQDGAAGVSIDTGAIDSLVDTSAISLPE